MNKKFLSSVLLIAFLLPFFSSCQQRKFNLPVKNLTITTKDGREITVKAELAVKPEERNYGFMNRKKIPEGTGMLFVFESDQMLHFWMKDTPTPLSIAYIDRKGVIADILDMTPYSLTNVNSSRYVRYALEVPQGWYEKAGIAKGDILTLNFR